MQQFSVFLQKKYAKGGCSSQPLLGNAVLILIKNSLTISSVYQIQVGMAQNFLQTDENKEKNKKTFGIHVNWLKFRNDRSNPLEI